MKKKAAATVGALVREKLFRLRDETGADFNVLLTQFAIERFLYRLSQSTHADRFVLKGAALFRVWTGSLHRPTKDVDLLRFGESTPLAVEVVIREILSTPVEDDGIVFDADSVTAEEIREGTDYGGVRVKIAATLDKAQIGVQADIGFGDAITPAAREQEYPVLVGMPAPKLRMYPVETVVAEKLEAAVKLGMINSRMKDFYDLLVIFRRFPSTDDVLVRAIAATFARRGTSIPQVVPPGLSDEFGSDPTARQLWRQFLSRMQIQDAPGDFAAVVSAVRDRAWPLIVAAGRPTQ